jgi:biopolymer transport protein ExbB/TolQ
MASRKAGNGWLVAIVVSAVLVVAGPMTGVFFSVLGLRQAFSSTGSTEPSAKARVLAEGISESMNATMFGMILALVALIMLVVSLIGYFKTRRSASEEAGDERR